MRRLLAVLAAASLLFGLCMLGLWAWSHGHTTRIPLGTWGGVRWSALSSAGRLMVTKSRYADGVVSTQSFFVEHWRLAMASLSLPALWAAVEIRRRAPRSGRRVRPMQPLHRDL